MRVVPLLELGPDSSEEDNSELRVRSPAVARSSIQGEGQAGSLPFPVQMAYVRMRIMGGITSFPAVQSQVAGLLGEIWKTTGLRAGPFPAALGPKEPLQLQAAAFPSQQLLGICSLEELLIQDLTAITDSLIKLFNPAALLVPIIGCLVAH